jgi:molybdenum cofactor cytidylyltransferase
VVVTGHQGEAVRAALAGVPCTFAESAEPTGPTSASLHAGLRSLDEQTQAAVILLADMVRVTTAMIEQVAAAVAASPAGIVGSRYGGSVFAPPLAFGRPLWPELLAFNGEGGGKAVLLAHLDQAVILDWPGEALRDVDTAADFEELSS